MTDHSMICAGIDVSKTRLDIAIHPGGATSKFDYDAAGLAALDRFLEEHRVDRVGFEASGGYELRLMAHLRGRDCTAVRVQPAQVRAFARSLLQRAKNDRLDARLIARFVAQLETVRPLPEACFDGLLAELTYVEQLGQQIALLKTFEETAFDPEIRHRHACERERLEQMAARQLALLAARIREDAVLKERLDLLLSIKGVGIKGAITLVVRLPELGRASREEIAALCGLAPYDDDSGKRHGHRRVAGGRERLRRILFMCAFTATQHNPDLERFYRRLREKGKTHLVAVIATARKLVTLANAIITRKTPWKPKLTAE